MTLQVLPKKLLPFFWHFIKKYRWWFFAIQFFCFAWSLDHTLWPYIIMVLIDTITHFAGDKADAWHALAMPIAMGISLWIVVEIFYRVGGFMSAIIFPYLEADVRTSMFDYVLRHSHHYFSNHLAGSIANKISDMSQSITRIVQLIMQLLIPVILSIIIATIFFAQINIAYALILIGWLIVHMAIAIFFSKKCDIYSHIHAESRSHLSGKIVDALSNNTNIRLFSRIPFENRYLSGFQTDERTKHQQSLWYIEKMKFALGIASFFGPSIGMNWYMLYNWQQGHLSTGEVVFIFNTVWNIAMMAWLVGLELPLFYKEVGITKQALTIIQHSHDISDKPGSKPLIVTKGEIVFNEVTFRYQKQQQLFEKKTLRINPGEKVGLVGFSGSGKTTFVNLILRYYDVLSGAILIDGQDISSVSQDSLRSQISIIPQDPTLFHRSLIENIRYGRIDATDEEVIEAAKNAHCHDFIQKLPEKYNTSVGERGIKLSGGQRQRIAIARAILKNAPILILDEATSALDSVTESQIQQGLDYLMANHTCIVIAHRLSTLYGMDRILVFKEGKVVEEGTHEALIENNGYYAEVWNMQTGGFLLDYEDAEYEEGEEEE